MYHKVIYISQYDSTLYYRASSLNFSIYHSVSNLCWKSLVSSIAFNFYSSDPMKCSNPLFSDSFPSVLS